MPEGSYSRNSNERELIRLNEQIKNTKARIKDEENVIKENNQREEAFQAEISNLKSQLELAKRKPFSKTKTMEEYLSEIEFGLLEFADLMEGGFKHSIHFYKYGYPATKRFSLKNDRRLNPEIQNKVIDLDILKYEKKDWIIHLQSILDDYLNFTDVKVIDITYGFPGINLVRYNVQPNVDLVNKTRIALIESIAKNRFVQLDSNKYSIRVSKSIIATIIVRSNNQLLKRIALYSTYNSGYRFEHIEYVNYSGGNSYGPKIPYGLFISSTGISFDIRFSASAIIS